MSKPESLILEADHPSLRKIKPWLLTLLADADEGDIGRVELAVHELANNSVDHSGTADNMVTITGQRNQNSLKIQICDTGKPFDQGNVSVPDPDVPQERGYGLMIVEQLVDDLNYQRASGKNVWTASFTLGA